MRTRGRDLGRPREQPVREADYRTVSTWPGGFPSSDHKPRPTGQLRRRTHVGEDVVEDLREVALRLPADRGPDLRDRRDAVEHVLDTFGVDLAVGHVDELRRGSRQLEHTPREIDDADALLGADVEDLARGVGVHETAQRADGVVDVAEATRLAAVAVD